MRIGLAAIGIGTGAPPRVLAAAAAAAEARGLARLWCGEHVVMIDRPTSRYPYADSGRLAVETGTDWCDPLIALTYAAACTTTIGLGTGVLLLPEHNPLVVAKQAASLDCLSGGRLTLGVGIGWSADEFAALGVPFARRSARTAEYVEVMRQLWSGDPVSYDGEFARFEGVRSRPTPVHDHRVPVLMGGNADGALARVVAYGDGWYGFNLGTDAARERLGTLHSLCRDAGRDPDTLEVVLAPFNEPMDPADLPELAALGVDEVVLVDSPPADPAAAPAWVEALAGSWL